MSEKINLKGKVVIAILAALLLVAIIIIYLLVANGTNSRKLVFNEETNSYKVISENIEIKNGEGLTYNVSTKEYKWSIIVANNKIKDLDKILLKFEFYDEKGNVIKQVTKEIDDIRAKSEKEVVLDFGESELLVYDYKITEMEL